ncbi:hypothetical protein COX08_00195 [Candidatus Beckwithbacteria bacterium CG23_combo_of_CG06-09_8_20_14_all_34_8]|uniref:Trigger factor n=1 Tax=Candidatus Beckwithbacteria bacterium CG23_combo_of_CG06-09_8_20_14_all_34_8 TaxID=1974497 RepID=A0A2H0B949_9BACT|nr:MAG: hypothetical protein COX08_00195 [Candidatus Beckwithbacteria bacterium CG23_combo_of_CG06-09_8_20_14_all_34_8]
MTKKTPKLTELKSDTKTANNAKLSWLPKKTFELEITIPWKTITKTYEKILDKFTAETEIKGFRKGKAPKAKIETYVGKSKIYEAVVEEAVSDAYMTAIKQHNLKPIISPSVNPVSMEENKDWVVKVTSCEYPEIKLGEYEKEVRGIKAKNALWTPDKAGKTEEPKKDSKPNVDEIFETLIKTATVEMSDILIESETSRLLSQLVDQAQTAGITLAQYLDSKGMTKDQLKIQYQKLAENNLKVEFILSEIADDKKMELPMKEVEQLIAKTTDENAKKAYQDPRQKTHLAIMLRKQKVVDYLLSL